MPTATPTAHQIAALLADARERTLLLVSPVPEAELMNQHNRLMSPIVWDMGHIAHFEELWLVRNLDGPVEFGEMPGVFNPFENPRSVRGQLALPALGDTLDHMARTRRTVLDRALDGGGAADPGLLEGGYVFRMVAQHEYQHNETILQALQLKDEGARYRAPRAIAPPAGRPVPADADGMVRFPGGRVEMGSDDRTAAYDNERPRHAVEIAP
ncbi:MAG: DinB family protein, partial [Gemmatimonadetes bacterium]|nr:DinB family protein [Gemmatimonadota bacterium]